MSNPEMISEHFSFSEFTKTNSGLPNVPNEKEIEAGKLTAEKILEPVRTHFKKKYPDRKIWVQINSWFRSPEVNQAATKNPKSKSRHLFGEAVDFEIPNVPNDEIWDYIANSELPYDQVIAEKISKRNGSDGWIHVSHGASLNRREALSSTDGKTYLRGLHYVA